MDVYTEILKEKNEIFVNDPAFPVLVRLLNEGNLVLFIGAGLSRGVYKEWHELVKYLCDLCRVSHDEVEFSSKTKAETLLKWAQNAKDANPEAYHQALLDEFSHKGTTREVYDSIARLKARAYITLNYDDLLCNALFRENGPSSMQEPIQNSFRNSDIQNGQLFYMHGRIMSSAVNNVVLTETDFDQAYISSGTRCNFMDCLFSQYNILFLGCSLSEPIFKTMFKAVIKNRERFTSENTERKNYLYMLKPALYKEYKNDDNYNSERDHEAEKLRNCDNEQKRIATVTYDKINRNYLGLEQALQNLKDAVPVRNTFDGEFKQCPQ